MVHLVSVFLQHTEAHLGTFVLEVVPRIGESITLKPPDDTMLHSYTVVDVCHGLFYAQEKKEVRVSLIVTPKRKGK